MVWEPKLHDFYSFKFGYVFYYPECGLSCWMFHMSLKWVYILLLLDELVYRYQSYPVDWWNYVLIDFLDARSISLPKIIFFYFILEYSWKTMLWSFQVNGKGTQPYIHMYPFSPKARFTSNRAAEASNYSSRFIYFSLYFY